MALNVRPFLTTDNPAYLLKRNSVVSSDCKAFPPIRTNSSNVISRELRTGAGSGRGRLDVLPGASAPSVADRRKVHPILGSYNLERACVGSDGSNLRARQLSKAGPFLRSHVSEVFQVRARPQMRRIAAGWVIASVAYLYAWLDRSLCQPIGCPMRRAIATMLPIARCGPVATPRPASGISARLIYQVPEFIAHPWNVLLRGVEYNGF
jgi:hypothetical protein